MISSVLVFLGLKNFSQKSSPTPVKVQVKEGQKGYARQVINSATGGNVSLNNIDVALPQNFTSEKSVTIANRELTTNKIAAANSLTPMFELTAKTDDGKSITKFDKLLKITQKIEGDPKTAALYYFDTKEKRWIKLDSTYDSSTHELIAYTTHFTVFMAASADPNTTQPSSNPLIVDDGDPEPAFVPGGLTDPDQPEFWDFTGSGYNGSARYTGNSINSTAHNWATWTASVTGQQIEVFVTVPALSPGKALTKGATYVVTHAGGQTSVVIDQNANAGKSVSLGKYNFNGTGSVYLSDVVPEKGSYFASFIVFDAVSFGVPFDGNLDITPPKIENVKAITDMGMFRIEAKVTDIGSGVKEVDLFFNGQFYKMSAGANNIYYLSIPTPKNASLDYYIIATDKAGNQSIWNKGKGYVDRGTFLKTIGYYKGGLFCPDELAGYACGTKTALHPNQTNTQSSGDPINSFNGNFMESLKLLYLGGRPSVDLHITYNNLSNRESIFGHSWTYSYDYHLFEMNNPDFTGVFIQYPDGKVVTFTGPNLTPDPGYYEKLTKVGNKYELTFTNLNRAYFDSDGDIIRFEDNNKNGINFEYGDKHPFTNLSQVKTITADGGRKVTFDYDANGFVSEVHSGTLENLKLGYSDKDDLVSFTDGNQNETKFEYSDHNLAKRISPSGFNIYENTYDADSRVIHQSSGEAYKEDYKYESNDTVVTDANNNKTIYNYNPDGLLSEIVDAKSFSVKYEYTENKELAARVDQEGFRTEYEYDNHGNKLVERDPYKKEVKWTYDTNLNKPLTEINKIPNHITTWTYDANGNLKTETNAKNFKRTFDYDQFGELVNSTDFNNNPTIYTYNPFGDLESTTNGELAKTSYTYDELGRIKSGTNPKGFQYNYSFDANNNLLGVSGPLGYKTTNTYSKDNTKLTSTDANSGTSHFGYDKSFNLISSKGPMGFETTYTYGPMNEKLTMTSPLGHLTTYKYDEVYNLVEVKNAAGTVDETKTQNSYNKRRDLVLTIDPNNHKTNYDYDANHKLLSESHELNSITKYKYNDTSALIELRDPNDHPTTYTLDELDQITKKTDAELEETKYAYDGNGNVITLTNPRNFDTNYKFDKANRLVKIIDARNGNTDFTYDKNDNLTNIQDANTNSIAFTYNELDRKIIKLAGVSKTKYDYDLNGNLKTLTNPRNFATNFNYDLNDRNIKIIDPLTHETTIDYDKEANIKLITDRNTHTQKFGYDNLNRLVNNLDQEEKVEKYKYDKTKNLVEFTNKRGFTYKSTYDELDRLSVSLDPYNNSKKFTYDKAGNLLTSVNENGFTRSYNYDKVNRLTSLTDEEGNITENVYDKNGNLTRITDAEKNPTEYKFDELDRLIEKINAQSESEKYAYDKTQNVTEKKEADNTLNEYSYDDQYRLIKVINNFKASAPAGSDTNVTTAYSYDPNGNLTKQIDPLQHETSFEYTPLDLLQKETNPLINSWSYEYDPEENLTLRTDANNVKTNYEYYPDNILAKVKYPTYNVSYEYNETNFPTKMIDQIGTTSWDYDKLDRMTKQTDGLGRALGYEYDAVGNRTKLIYPDSRSIAYSYLKNNWLAKSLNSDNDLVNFTRNKVGAPTRLDRSNQTSETIAYDKVYRILKINDSETKYPAHIISNFDYTYNPVGHITKEMAQYGWRQPMNVNTDYTYDGLHRLTNVKGSDNNIYGYGHDASGNRTISTQELKQGTETKSYTYNPGNELVSINVNSPMPPNRVDYSYLYDKNGNRTNELIKDNTGIDRGTSYEFDFENRITKAQDYQSQNGTNNLLAHTDSSYDGNGRRLTETYYPGASDPGKRTEYTFDELDPVTENYMWDSTRMNIYRDSNKNLLSYQAFKSEKAPSGTSYWYNYDGRGNIAATTKSDGQSDHTYRYDPYGNLLPDTNGAANWTGPHNNYTLSQKAYDPNTNLYYFGARHYDPMTGTWMQEDSYRGQIQNPQTQHRYMYNNNSPINYVDRYGYSVLDDIWTSILSIFGYKPPSVNYKLSPTTTPTMNPINSKQQEIANNAILLSKLLTNQHNLDQLKSTDPDYYKLVVNSNNRFIYENPYDPRVPLKATEPYTWSSNWNPGPYPFNIKTDIGKGYPQDYIECVSLVSMAYNMSGINLSNIVSGNAGSYSTNSEIKKHFDIYQNGVSPSIPEPGDILNWTAGIGHVAIVTKIVDEGNNTYRIECVQANTPHVNCQYEYTSGKIVIDEANPSDLPAPNDWLRYKYEN